MDPPFSDVTFFGSMEVSWIPLSVTLRFLDQRRSFGSPCLESKVFFDQMSVFMVFHGSRLVFHGFSWFQVGFHGFRWVSMVFHGSRLVFHGSSSVFMVFEGFRLFLL